MADKSILSVDWDARELRIVRARAGKSQVRVEDVFAVDIPESARLGDAESLGPLLREALNQEGIHCKRVIVDIPRDQAVLHTLSLPRASLSDLAGMVEVQIVKELSYPLSEAVVDFAVPPAEEGAEGPQDVLVAVVRTEVIAFYRQVCEAAGLRLDRIGLRPYANRVAVTRFLGGSAPDRVLIVDIGPSLTEIDVLRHGNLVFSRAASVHVPEPKSPGHRTSIGEWIDPGARRKAAEAKKRNDAMLDDDDVDKKSPDAEDAPLSILSFEQLEETDHRGTQAIVTDLIVEVRRSIEAYRSTDVGAEMDCAVICGATGVEEMLAETIHRSLGIDAEVYNAASCFDGDAERGAAASGFSAALGLVLGQLDDETLHFDFLHPKRKEAAAEARMRKVPLAAAVVAMFLVAGWIAYAKGPAKSFARVRELEQEITEVKAQIREEKPFLRMVQAAASFDGDQVVWIDELRRLVAALPADAQEVVLERIDMYQKDRRLNVPMRFKSSAEASKIAEAIESFEPEGWSKKAPYYSIRRGSGRQEPGPYSHEEAMQIEIAPPGGKKSSRDS